ncbi:MAG: hypothetical protein ABIJ15_08280 [bacterium]
MFDTKLIAVRRFIFAFSDPCVALQDLTPSPFILILSFLLFFQTAPQAQAAGRTTPSAITDLMAVLWKKTGEAMLTWTAPGGDGLSGRASFYEIKYATFTVADLSDDADAWWNFAKKINGTGAPPSGQGTMEVLRVKGLPPMQDVFFHIRAMDEDGNLSPVDFENLSAQKDIREIMEKTVKQKEEYSKTGEVSASFFIEAEKKLFITFAVPREIAEKFVNFITDGGVPAGGEIILCDKKPGGGFSCSALLTAAQKIPVDSRIKWQKIDKGELELLHTRSYFLEDNVADVVLIYDEAIKKHPREEILYEHLAGLFRKRGMTGYALDVYYACLEKNPRAVEARRGLALLCEELEKEVRLSFGKYKRMAVEQWLKLLMTKYDGEASEHIGKLR